MNTLQVCSLLVIPPPIGRMVPQGGFPSDLTELNLSGWADLVQDVAVGLQVLLPRLCLNLGTPAIALLQLLEPATGVGFLLPLLPPKTPLYVYGSLTVGSLHVVEPDCSADPGIWSDLHLWRSYQSEYSHGRYAWICGASSRPYPSRFLQLEHTSSGGPSTPRAMCIPITSASCGESLTTDSPPAGPGATGSYAVGPEFASPTTTGSSDGATLVPATPILQEWAGNPLSAGSAAASQAVGERGHLQHPH